MEHFDVAIIGGGSAGLAALKQLSNLEKQAVLIEAGKTVGSKNVSGGILYSKKPKNGKVYNVEDVYGQEFVAECSSRKTDHKIHPSRYFKRQNIFN